MKQAPLEKRKSSELSIKEPFNNYQNSSSDASKTALFLCVPFFRLIRAVLWMSNRYFR
jgi:hypothetical protein